MKLNILDSMRIDNSQNDHDTMSIKILFFTWQFKCTRDYSLTVPRSRQSYIVYSCIGTTDDTIKPIKWSDTYGLHVFKNKYTA